MAQWKHMKHLKKVGAIIERPNFYPYMTAQENLELVCKIKDIPFTKVTEKLELVGLVETKRFQIQNLFFRNETTFSYCFCPIK